MNPVVDLGGLFVVESVPSPVSRPCLTDSGPLRLGSQYCLPRLFGTIRDDAARGMSIRQIAARYHVHRRMVRQALAAPVGPPPRKQATRPARAIDPIRDVLDKLAGEPLTIWEIWATVTDEHDSDASYAAIRDYIRNRRLARQPGPPPDQVTARRRHRPGSGLVRGQADAHLGAEFAESHGTGDAPGFPGSCPPLRKLSFLERASDGR